MDSEIRAERSRRNNNKKQQKQLSCALPSLLLCYIYNKTCACVRLKQLYRVRLIPFTYSHRGDFSLGAKSAHNLVCSLVLFHCWAARQPITLFLWRWHNNSEANRELLMNGRTRLGNKLSHVLNRWCCFACNSAEKNSACKTSLILKSAKLWI